MKTNKTVVKIDSNNYKNIWVCSDVHNDYETLNKAVTSLSIDEEDNLLIIGGDLLDRGINPDGCLKFSLDGWKKRFGDNEIHDTKCDVVYLKGNHEKMIEKYITEEYNKCGTEKREYYYNTIRILESAGGGSYSSDDINMLQKELAALPLLVEIEFSDKCVRIAHAAVPDDEIEYDIDAEYVIWGDTYYNYYHKLDNKKKCRKKPLIMITGHVPVQRLRLELGQLSNSSKDNEIWIKKCFKEIKIDVDCGNGYRNELCGYTPRLAMLNVRDMKAYYY